MAKAGPLTEDLVIRDAIHGDITFESGMLAVLDSPQMQRLRYVRQLGTTYLTFPSAHHSRYEHSLGTYYLTKEICQRIMGDSEESRHVMLAGLLHDVGHSAFSHLSEPIVKKYTGKSHEEMGIERVREGKLADAIERHGYSVRKLCDILSEKNRLGAVIWGDLGTDRMDYLLRDSYFCGVYFSGIDAQRLIKVMKISDEGLVIPYKDVSAVAESLLVSRHLMRTSIYTHHSVRIAQEMLRKSLATCIGNGRLEIDELLDGADDHVLFSLVEKGDPLARRVSQRRLFKRSYETERVSDAKKALPELAEKLSDAIGAENFVISTPESSSKHISFKIQYRGKIRNLVEYSSLARALQESNSHETILVATDRKDRDKARKVCHEVLE
ncbi:MAG: HD domain-containing protein [Candidatus Micrarchaeia archaeon]